MFVMHIGKRILIADDSKTMTNITFRILKDANYADIDVVHDAGSALAALHRKEYDLVITDCQMQPVGGRELTKLIRADARLSKVRIILVTGLDDSDDDLLLDGADGHLKKPFEPRALAQKEDMLSTAALLA
jgi:CheY-like chemotaxis protein